MRKQSQLAMFDSTRAWVVEIYRNTRRFPTEERFGLQSQTRRAAVSVIANIAEGHGRGTQGDFERHLRIASGSLAEVRQLILVARDLTFMSAEKATDMVTEIDRIGRQLTALTIRVARSRR